MNVVGIIAEYNPFHNGHKFHIQKAKELCNADFAIIIMSGNFVQRGIPAIIDKYSRTKACLNNGADIVIELPVRYATGSSKDFATGAIKILDKLGIVTHLSFGCESDDVADINYLAEIINNEPEEYKSYLSKELRKGNSYPKARANAIANYTNNAKFIDILDKPNNILAIEYLSALKSINSSIIAIPVKRNDNGYNSTSTSTSDIYASALTIRTLIENNELTSTYNFVPPHTREIINNYFLSTGLSSPVNINDYSQLLYYKLNSIKKECVNKLNFSTELCNYLDIDYNIANKIITQFSRFTTISDFVKLLKTKNYTYSRLSRALLHILLDIKSKDQEVDFVKILGMNIQASRFIRTINETNKITLINKPASASKLLTQTQYDIYQEQVSIDDLYYYIYKSINNCSAIPINEISKSIEIV